MLIQQIGIQLAVHHGKRLEILQGLLNIHSDLTDTASRLLQSCDLFTDTHHDTFPNLVV